MSNFLDLEPDNSAQNSNQALRDILAKVPVTSPATRLHPQLSDRLAEQHGFSSRESQASRVVGGRRQARGMQVEETRQLSIRMPLSLYNDFLTFADEHKLTYNEAIRALLDRG